MVFFEAVQAFFSLDLGFFIDVIMGNLLWVFMFAVMIYFFFDKKNLLKWFVIWSILLWAILDWETLTGFAFSVPSLLLVYYISKLAVLAFAESIPALRKYLVLVSTVQAYTVIILFTFIMGGSF